MQHPQPPPFFSAVTAHHQADHDKAIAELEARFSPHVPGLAILPQTASRSSSMPFGRVVQVLELCSQTQSRIRQQEMIAELIAHSNLSANPVLERMALFRILLPSLDRHSVYGFKTTRLCQSFQQALRRLNSSSSAVAEASLQRWQQSPELVQGLRAGTMVCMPETAIAMAFGQCVNQRQNQQHVQLTIMEVATLCQSLTDSYTREQRRLLSNETGMMLAGAAKNRTKVDNVSALLLQVLPRLDYEQCKFLVRLLLRTVPMGVGPTTVLAGVSPDAAAFISLQRDLTRLAIWASPVQANGGGAQQRDVHLAYGVPFTPMTCGTVSSPYMMRWLFSKEEISGTPINPRQGRLVVMSSGVWCVPISGNKVGMSRFADIDDPICVEVKSRKRHVELLKQFRRGGMLNEKHARGLMISYMMCTDGPNSVMMLLRSVIPVASALIEFEDERHCVEEPVSLEAHGADVAAAPAPKKKTKKTKRKNAESVLLMDMEEIEERLRMIASAPDAVSWVGHRMKLRVASVFDDDQSNTVAEERKKIAQNGIMVQTKLDGDRLQAHVFADGEKKLHVHLFTKHGKQVDTLYSDVTKDLTRAFSSSIATQGGCILDGELILVDSKGAFLPWSNVKWRYNTSTTEPSKRLSEILQERDDDGIVSVVYDDHHTLNGQDTDTFMDFTMAPRRTLRSWTGLGAAQQHRLRARVLEPRDARLLFVVFDMLMIGSTDITGDSCLSRWNRLKGLASKFARLQHVKILGDEHVKFVKNADELVKALEKAVQMQYEGVVAKDTRDEYRCKESSGVRKIKVRGHDINTVVLGSGFSLSNNPRMWGFMTGILHQVEGSDEGDDHPVYRAYVRVESLEGDSPGLGLSHVCGRSSTVSVAALRKAAPKAIKAGDFMVRALSPAAGALVVRWSAIDKDNVDIMGCDVHYMMDFPRDIQWLCNPHDCAFTLSVHGDLRPVAKDGLMVPRFPVGRLEFRAHQSSKCDTAAIIEAKFRESAVDADCMKLYFDRKLHSLRRAPSTPQKLDQVHQMLQGKRDPDAEWPQQPPVLYSLTSFSAMLVNSGFEPLTDIEKRVLSTKRVGSQWTGVDLKNGGRIASASPLPKTMAENERNAQKQADMDSLCKRLHELHSIKVPFLQCGSGWPGDEALEDDDDDDYGLLVDSTPAPDMNWQQESEDEYELTVQ